MQRPRCIQRLLRHLAALTNLGHFPPASTFPAPISRSVSSNTMSNGEPQAKKHKPDPDSLDIHRRLEKARRDVSSAIHLHCLMLNINS
ncbi:hypothetical protein E2C01_087059 [Portunus trituberculatus]|uniref:Uncharacterized protein n=1 Tax=Portunus trituberculatus TaxID=210409 RepID=A0A5B7J2E5_PORTR|nr:hypothetical protein [Portunus trituberculatus]